MQAHILEALEMLKAFPEAHSAVSLLALLIAAWLGNWLVRHVLARGIERMMSRGCPGLIHALLPAKLVYGLTNIVPVVILGFGVHFIPGVPPTAISVIENVCVSVVVVIGAIGLCNFYDAIHVVYLRRPGARERSIKSYLQLMKIVTAIVAGIMCISILIDRSPLILLSGLGAMAAVLMLIFQSTLLSFVASIQINSADIIRVGDWVEIPNLADGEVIDVALHTVKIQNWDKTITTIPTQKFITDSFKNWRGMIESGGRRIMRQLNLDQNSVHFLSNDEIARLSRFRLLHDYLEVKQRNLEEWNGGLPAFAKDEVNMRRLTNLGTFRAYAEQYLRNHAGIHQGMTLIVRQREPGEQGIGIQLYCFTNTVAWVEHESIQSDIFDHLLAIIGEFGLRLHQSPTGADFRELSVGSAMAAVVR